MTKEEAIELLEDLDGAIEDNHGRDYDEAFRMAIEALSADARCEDTQTEEQARFVAKETELAHIEAKLENAEKRLQSVCTANFVADQLDHLRNMTNEERWDFFIKFFSPSAKTVQGEWEHWGSPFSDEREVIDTIVCSVCGARFIEPKDDPKNEYNYCPNCGTRMKEV